MKSRVIIAVIVGLVLAALMAILSLRQPRSPFLQVEAIAAADSLEAALTALDRETSLRVAADSVAAEALRELAQARESAVQVEAAARESVRQAETRIDELLQELEPEIGQEIQEAIVEDRTARASVVLSLQVQLTTADSMTAVEVQKNFALRSENAVQRRALLAYERQEEISAAIIEELEPGWYDHWIVRAGTHAAVFYLGGK